MKAKEFFEKHNEILRQYDYNYERYKIKFSVALVKLDETLNSYDIDFDSMIRYSDQFLKIDEMLYFFLFLGTDIKKAFQALLNLEKKLLSKFDLYYANTIFQAAVVSKEKGRDIEEMIRICFELLNESKQGQIILTESDL